MQNHSAAFKKVLSNRPFVGAILFTACLYVVEEFVFNFPQIYILQSALEFYLQAELLLFFVSAIGSFAICFVFVWTALTSSRGFQVLYLLLFTVSSIVQYGFWKAVQRFLLAIDLKIATATPLETWQGAGVLYFDWRFIVPVIVFVVLLFLFSDRQGLKTSVVRFGALFLLIGLLSFSHRFMVGRNLNLGLSISSFYQTISRFVIDSTLPPMRGILSYQHPEKPRNNIVLVIDESIRGDHLGINGYRRETTPFLSALAASEASVHNFGLAVSGGTCSAASNALIITGVRPGLDEFDQTARYPTVFQYAKAMGYKTYYMDAEASVLWNGLTPHDLRSIDSWLKAGDFGDDIQSDFRAAEMIVKTLSEESGNFIVLNKRGVHFLYRHSYPPESAVWLPIPDDRIGDPVLISNPYDNAILYNVNTFFERLLANPEILENTTILYTSDHGQTLFAHGTNWLHCKDAPEEVIVPLMLIGRNLPPIDVEYRASHSNILPTLLDLMRVPPNQRIHPYAPSLFTVTGDMITDRVFFAGSLQLLDFPDSYMETFQ